MNRNSASSVKCTKIIINAGISKIYCFKESKDYSIGSRYLLKEANIEVVEYDKNLFE